MMSIQQQYLVSIIMPVYNCAQYIESSIKSVQNQTYTNWELLAVDDCSSDDSAEIVKAYASLDSRIRYIGLHQNSGAAEARNRAIREARGTFLAFLDSDDIWYPTKIEKQISYMIDNNVAFTCTAYACIDEYGQSMGKAIYPFRQSGYWKCLYYGNCIGNSTVVYRLSNEGKIYAPNIRKRNDFALWLKILKKEPLCIGIQDILADYRVRNGSLSKDKASLIKYQWSLYRDIEKLPIIHCVAALICLFVRKVWNPNIRKIPNV